MQVTVDIPEQKSGLDAAIAKQFADIQRQLMGLVKEQSASKSQMHSLMMSGMADQQDAFLKAMEQLMGMVKTALQSPKAPDGMVEALRGLRTVMADLPDDLKASLDKQYQRMQPKALPMTVHPKITVQMPEGMMNRLDSLETALLGGMRRFRTRTFGSNGG